MPWHLSWDMQLTHKASSGKPSAVEPGLGARSPEFLGSWCGIQELSMMSHGSVYIKDDSLGAVLCASDGIFKKTLLLICLKKSALNIESIGWGVR